MVRGQFCATFWFPFPVLVLKSVASLAGKRAGKAFWKRQRRGRRGYGDWSVYKTQACQGEPVFPVLPAGLQLSLIPSIARQRTGQSARVTLGFSGDLGLHRPTRPTPSSLCSVGRLGTRVVPSGSHRRKELNPIRKDNAFLVAPSAAPRSFFTGD
ncbi:hypothetical protein B0H67DRAFT_584907 [Lasiosphaeris hirsuta]|uniref:Secreted protein n=1 Tax=Lasiosphaeris hirsuta TaxID=260670 RepID=A0AA40DPZ6_9PEZI|nr:hypothetical protein B0H67DRAFT_584907 [Lasiosphaeris hirsuta]